MKFLKKDDMVDILTMKEAIEADKQALALYCQGKTHIPLRTNIDAPAYHGQHLYMPGLAGDAAGIKIVSVYPDNARKNLPSVPATMILLDEDTGQVSAMMDGTYLTQLRTGAVAGAATDLLAREDSRVFVLIGTGGQAPSQLEAVLSVRPIDTVYVKGRDFAKSQQFAQEMTDIFGEQFKVTIEAVEDVGKAVREADIITVVTTAHSPVFDAADVQPGTHVNGIGSYTPDMQEIPGDLMAKADKIYVDTQEGVIHEAGDLIKPMEEGLLSESDITGELGELVLEKIPGRESAHDITIFKSTGTAVLDLVVAKEIYRKACQAGRGQDLSL